jgi:hypothetical protein
MTSTVNDTPPAPTTPVADIDVPAAGSGDATTPPAARAHWTTGVLNGAGRLITTAANDELVRNMIGTKARNQVAATVFGGTIMGAIAARVATRSVPGALLVGGALLAKAVYDQRKAKGKLPRP